MANGEWTELPGGVSPSGVATVADNAVSHEKGLTCERPRGLCWKVHTWKRLVAVCDANPRQKSDTLLNNIFPKPSLAAPFIIIPFR